MTRNITLIVAFVTCLLFSEKNFGQSTDLKSAGNFTVFTASGAFTNNGLSVITGDIGTTTAGQLTGFPPGVYSGVAHVADTEATLAANDLINAFANLNTETCTSTLGATFGNGETLTAGVHCLPGSAGVVAGSLTLNGAGDANSLFIIKIGGALRGIAANIILENGASWENVYWVVNGAFSLEDLSTFRGNIIANGAIDLSLNSSVVGRVLSTSGAITLNSNTVRLAEVPLPVTLISFTVSKAETQTALLNWTTTTETNSDHFEIEHSVNGKTWKQLGSVNAKGESSNLVSYQYTDTKPVNSTNLYRLKMIDKDATFTYSRIQSLKFEFAVKTVLYPNPVMDYLTLSVDDMSQVQRIQINNIIGNSVFDKTKTTAADMSANLDVKSLPSGLYFVRITRDNGNIALSKIVKQ
jgi:hypothetical protein